MASANRKIVMKYFCKSLLSTPLLISLAGGAVLMIGCAGTTDTSLSEVESNAPGQSQIATIKPGAALDFIAHIDGELQVGAYSDVEIVISSGYDAGTLTARASGTDGLAILGSSAALNHDLADGQAVWRVSVQPDDDGLHYLTVMATVSGLSTGEPQARAFSFAIDPGTKSDPRKTTNKALIIQSGDQSLAILDAEETIIPDE